MIMQIRERNKDGIGEIARHTLGKELKTAHSLLADNFLILVVCLLSLTMHNKIQ